MTEEIKPEEVKPVEQPMSEKVLQINRENAELAAALAQRDELRAKLELGGRAIAGQVEKIPEELAKEDAKKLLSNYGY